MAKASARRRLLVGNWKMNGLAASGGEIAELVCGLPDEKADGPCEIWICPPATLLTRFIDRFADAPVSWGAQDCHSDVKGAHTGDISAEMLADAGAVGVIVGHSERRRDHGESNALVCAKAAAAHRAGLTAIVCIGESADQRRQGALLSVLEDQLRNSLPPDSHGGNSIVAYEPIWAIGTGLVPAPEQIVEVHAYIRDHLNAWALRGNGTAGATIPILYGGSLGPQNADWLLRLEHVDGGLIGNASLRAESLLAIVAACP